MNDTDQLQRFLFVNSPVRGEIVHLTQSFQTILNQHPYPDFLRPTLGQALATASLLCATVKFQGRLTVQFRGKGKIKLLLAQCNPKFHLRGLIQWDEDLQPDDVLPAFEEGTLAIMIDPEVPGGRRYQGIVEWRGQSLAEALEGYFMQSEQLPTRLWFAVNETSAAGLLLQVMPNEKPALYQQAWDHLTLLAQTISPMELLNLPADALLRRLFHEEDIRLFDPSPVIFQCNCSTNRSENALLLLGKEEVETELENKQNIVVTCEFCNHAYAFDRVDIARIFKQGNKPASSTELQ